MTDASNNLPFLMGRMQARACNNSAANQILINQKRWVSTSTRGRQSVVEVKGICPWSETDSNAKTKDTHS